MPGGHPTARSDMTCSGIKIQLQNVGHWPLLSHPIDASHSKLRSLDADDPLARQTSQMAMSDGAK